MEGKRNAFQKNITKSYNDDEYVLTLQDKNKNIFVYKYYDRG